MEKTELAKIIQNHCCNCYGGSGVIIKNCIGSDNCKLHFFRNGDKIKRYNLKKAIYEHCFICMSGDNQGCLSEKTCVLFPYRLLYLQDIENNKLKCKIWRKKQTSI